MPDGWAPDPGASADRRDLALDLIRGLAMVILVLNHTVIVSAIEHLGGAVLSAAEMLVAVSGVVVGIVFGSRWRRQGPRATTAMLLRRSRKLYLASVAVVGIVALLIPLPGLATDALAVSPTMEPPRDMYAYESLSRLLLAIVTLEAGPWQFNILGFFIASLAAAPAVLYALSRGWWPLVLVASWTLFALGRELHIDVLPAQSERPFPTLIWQILFVHGILVGWYRERLTRLIARHRGAIVAAVLALATVSAVGVLAGPLLAGPERWPSLEQAHFDKGTLDLARVAAMMSMTGALYIGFRRYRTSVNRLAGPVLLPFGQNSFYVFIMHVFLCLAIASVPLLADGGLGLAGNSAIELAGLALLWLMVRRRFLFRWVPR